jgi:hypothetical protein
MPSIVWAMGQVLVCSLPPVLPAGSVELFRKAA